MLGAILRWLAYSLAIVFIAWAVPGIGVESFLAAMIVCLIMALINAFVKPVLQFISLPINFLTLGLFSFVLNALLFMLGAKNEDAEYYDMYGTAQTNFMKAVVKNNAMLQDGYVQRKIYKNIVEFYVF